MKRPEPWASPGNRRLGLAAISAGVLLVLSALSLTTPWRLLDMRVFDFLSTSRLPHLPAGGPVIVAIDEPSFAELALQWPWPRDVHARLVESLREAGARAIGIDIIFADPSSPQADAALAAAVGPDVVLAADETFMETPQADQFIRVEPLAELTAAGALPGVASIPLDGDGTLRRLPAYPDGFARELLRLAGTEPAPGGGLLRVFGPARTYPTVSYYQALDPPGFLPDEFFRDRVVIVGLSLQNAPTIDAGGADAYATSYTLRSGRLTSGAEIQATMFDNLRAGLLVTPAGDATRLAALVLAVFLAALAVRRGTGWRSVAVGLAAVVASAFGSYALLDLARIYLSPVGPALAFVLVAAGQGARDYAAERRLRRGITRAFSQYLSPVLVERLASDPSLLRLGGERRTLTILFTDVRGFTTVAEKMKDEPERLTTLINRLLDPLSRIVLEEGGTIDKYIGDCLMAFWNAPLDEPDHAAKAVRSALRMREAMAALNCELASEARSREEPLRLDIGIGINTGECIVGNMGSDLRFDYSAIGDAVNLASRLEGKTRDYDIPIIIGPETARLIADRFEITEIDRIAVKGRSEIVPIYAVASRGW
ncbi:MAG: adenylate/guanylate cyclase domain-containing protein [Rhizobiaceae bacterium]|nr:adenylate/guanylate cyclase domain-containing protein [Rhizobiaceae bacterium]MCV0407984.1 adenylate/guanylate cyclase domain-containing protein [Rhizobiaceae bacterium]